MINFGIIGTANIAHRFIRGANKCSDVCVKAIASRDQTKAQAWIKEYPSLIAYATYDALFQDQSIDAVYIATPNFTHEALIMHALSHGKHVLCEKPIMLNEAAVTKCFAYAKQKGLMLMEAMKPAFLPTTLQAKKWLESGVIGTLQYISASYCHGDITPFLDGWHNDPTLGGGILYDLGVYPIGFVHALLHQTPIIDSVMTRRLENGCDIFQDIHCHYDTISVQYICACDTVMKNRAILCGTKGYIEIENFWKSESAFLFSNTETVMFKEQHHQSEFQYQIQSFCESILHHDLENSIMSEEMSRRNAHLIDLIMQKGESQ